MNGLPTGSNGDWWIFNAESACGGSDPNTGIFSRQQSSTGAYICGGAEGIGGTLNSGFSGSDQNVLNTAWPGPFDTARELFAEEIANILGYTDAVYPAGPDQGSNNLRSLDHYQGTFTCIKTLESGLGNGSLPSSYPTDCPSS